MGMQSRYGDDRQLTRATRLAVLRVGFAVLVTVGAIFVSYAVLVGVKGAVGVHAAWEWGHWWAVGALVLVGLLAAVTAFRRVRVVAQRVRGAELLPDDSRFVAMLTRLCALGDVPRPRLALIDLPMRNAFVGEGPGQPVTIYLSRHAAYELPDDQIEAVLAHELFHVAHGDTALLRVLERIADTADRKAPEFVSVYVLRSVRSLMRQREHAADRGRVVHVREALALHLQAFGPTRPHAIVQNYHTSIVYRRNFYRSWIFGELEPGVDWPYVDNHRLPVWSTVFRLELQFKSF